MTQFSRPDGLLPVERFDSAGPEVSGSTWSEGLPRQARGHGPVGSVGAEPTGSLDTGRTGVGGAGLPAAPPPGETSAPPAQPGPPVEAASGHPTVDGRPTPRQAPVTAPPVTPPRTGPNPAASAPVQGRPPAPPQQQAPQQAPVPPQPTEPDPSDASAGSWILVKKCQAGDQRAFQELYSRYHEVVFRYVLFRLGDRTLAEDLTQETFLRALRRISSVSYQGRDIGAWFVTIARNLIFDHVKSSRYRLESTTADMVEHSPTTHGPEQQVIENATNSELLKAIDKLNHDQQDCIRMRFLQGLSVAETAQRMNRAEGAVKALQHRAVRRLAQLMPEGLR